MKHFLFDIHYPTFGGPHNQALQLAEPLRLNNWETHVLLPEEEGNALGRLRDGGIDVIQAPLHRVRASRDPRLHAQFIAGLGKEIALIRRLIREREIDLVLIAGLYTVQTAIAARLENVPVVWQVLDTVAPNFARHMIMPMVSWLADSVMTTGMDVARQHPGAVKLGDRLIPYYPPVNTTIFRPDPDGRIEARGLLGVPQDALLIGTVGNLNRTKGHQHLIESAKLILESQPDVYVRVLGASTPTHASYEAELRNRVSESTLANNRRFEFIDPKNRVSKLLPAFDVILSTSLPRSEGIPTTLLEAMSVGLPIVATKVGGVSEVVEEGVSGFVVAPLDQRAIADATLRLLRDSSLRSQFAVRARQLALTKYDLRICVDAHVNAFEIAQAHKAQSKGRAQII